MCLLFCKFVALGYLKNKQSIKIYYLLGKKNKFREIVRFRRKSGVWLKIGKESYV